jgi:DnaA family protein
MKQIPLNILSAPEQSFAGFEVGTNDTNRMALEAMLALARQLLLSHGATHAGAGKIDAASAPTTPAALPPLLVWGPSGSGKTHLLRAFAHHLAAEGTPSAYLSPEVDWPAELDPAWRALLMDDCEGLDTAQQHAAFGLFVKAQAAGLAVLAAAAAPPVDLPLREDLRTRLGWGLVFALQPLGEAERRAVLRREADARGLFLSDDVMDYMLARFERDLGSLVGLLNRLDQYALATQRRLTVPLVRDMLRDAELSPPESLA